MAWMIVCTALVMLMAPGMGFFYSGVSGRRSALSMIWLSLMAMAVVGIQVDSYRRVVFTPAFFPDYS